MSTSRFFAAFLSLSIAAACGSSGGPSGQGDAQDGGATASDGGATQEDGGATDGGRVLAGSDGGIGAAPTCDTGGLTGKACAPDGTTSVAGALVTVDTIDCHGQLVHLETTAAADGRFTMTGVPANDVNVTITVGSFVQRGTAHVNAGAPTPLDTSKTCFRPTEVKIAVLSGHADRIEMLLQQLGFTPDVIDGYYPASGTPPALAFLNDLSRLSQYQILFIDCGAFKKGGTIDLGAQPQRVLSNLRAFVAGGGSLYASDWAGVVLALAYPAHIVMRLETGGDTQQAAIASPFYTERFVGYAPQEVTATVSTTALASYLGSNTVRVSFPMSPPTNHWAMLTPARSGVTADISGDVAVCGGNDCNQRGRVQNTNPLAVTFRPDPSRTRGGNVIFTSFHNISQPTDDVKRILQYLIFRL